MATTYKVLGQAAPTDTNNANVYTVPASTSAVVSTIHIANLTTSAATFRIYVRVNGTTAANANCIAYDVSLAANSLYAITTGLTLGAGDVITVRTSTADALAFSVFGQEIS